jgi:hypothetical protein
LFKALSCSKLPRSSAKAASNSSGVGAISSAMRGMLSFAVGLWLGPEGLCGLLLLALGFGIFVVGTYSAFAEELERLRNQRP